MSQQPKNNERPYSVYIHTAPNGKQYVGITSREPAVRWRNGQNYRHNAHFTAAIKKYGWENIKHEIVATGLTSTEAEQMEQDLIARYRSNDSRYGYNSTSGGESGKEITEELRQRIRESKKGQCADPEFRRRQSLAHIGKSRGTKEFLRHRKHVRKSAKQRSGKSHTTEQDTQRCCVWKPE